MTLENSGLTPEQQGVSSEQLGMGRTLCVDACIGGPTQQSKANPNPAGTAKNALKILGMDASDKKEALTKQDFIVFLYAMGLVRVHPGLPRSGLSVRSAGLCVHHQSPLGSHD